MESSLCADNLKHFETLFGNLVLFVGFQSAIWSGMASVSGIIVFPLNLDSVLYYTESNTVLLPLSWFTRSKHCLSFHFGVPSLELCLCWSAFVSFSLCFFLSLLFACDFNLSDFGLFNVKRRKIIAQLRSAFYILTRVFGVLCA